VMRSVFPFGGGRQAAFGLAFGLGLILSPRPLPAQIPPNAAAQADRCSGPLGPMLPECQATSIPVDLPLLPRPATSSMLPQFADPALWPTQSRAERHEIPSMPPPEKNIEPPTEFQRLTASSIGRLLPIFGASLFDKVPVTFAPLDRVPVGADYLVGPGDELVIRAWGQVNLNLEVTVDRAGAIYIPHAGNVTVAGIRFQQLPGYLRSQLERVFRNFDLNVNMGQLRSIQIFVVGQARRPGTYTVSSLSTLVNAVFASGGPSGQGSMRRIQLKRGAQVVSEFDLYDLLLDGDKSKDARLLPGDVVYIPPAGPQVAVAGSVKNPAVYELRGEGTVAGLIRMAGGLSPVADGRRATLERIRQRSFRETLEFSLLGAGLDTPVEDGDLLQVRAIAPRFANTVTLRGNVANPGRFPWRAGMRLRDIIPDKESLVTREYWKKRNLLGFTAPEDALPAEPAKEMGRKPPQTTLDGTGPEINWSYAVIERRNPDDLKSELLQFHLGKLVLERDERQNLELRPGDVVTVFSQADFRVPRAQQNRFVRLEGEFNAAGVYTVLPGETLGALIQRAGGLTPQAYLFAAELLRESTRREQQRGLDQFANELERQIERTASTRLGSTVTPEESAGLLAKVDSERRFVQKLRAVQATGRIVLNLEPGETGITRLMDLALEDDDRFVVPPRPSTVNVLGAVYNQNSFVYEPGQRIGDYLRRAGGFTRSADKGRVFVIRADGSVVPKQDHAYGLFKPAFETGRLNPGDAIVVPEAIFKTTFLHGLRDWSQVISQFALGAAAVNVLK
jgi:polysaccharide biosynthesis/export protein